MATEQSRKLRAQIEAGARYFHFTPSCTAEQGPKGGIHERHEVWRANGKLRTWVKQPDWWELPIKNGLRYYTRITPSNSTDFCVEEECLDAIQARAWREEAKREERDSQ